MWSESHWMDGWISDVFCSISLGIIRTLRRRRRRRMVGVWYSPNASSNYPVWQNPFRGLRSYWLLHPPRLMAWNCDAVGWCIAWGDLILKRAYVFLWGVLEIWRRVQIKDETVAYCSRFRRVHTLCNPGVYSTTPARGLQCWACVVLLLDWPNEGMQRRERKRVRDWINRAACLGECEFH